MLIVEPKSSRDNVCASSARAFSKRFTRSASAAGANLNDKVVQLLRDGVIVNEREGTYTCRCGTTMQISSFNSKKFLLHLQTPFCRTHASIPNWMEKFNQTEPKSTESRVTTATAYQPRPQRIDASSVCHGLWQRKYEGDYSLTSKQWRGERDTRTSTPDGIKVTGTWRATGKHPCKEVALKPDGTPTGTMTCINCAKIQFFPSFQKARASKNPVTLHAITSKPNYQMNAAELRSKLALRTAQVKQLKQSRRRRHHRIRQSRMESAQEAINCGDVKRFIRDIQCLAKRGTLKEKKLMWFVNVFTYIIQAQNPLHASFMAGVICKT